MEILVLYARIPAYRAGISIMKDFSMKQEFLRYTQEFLHYTQESFMMEFLALCAGILACSARIFLHEGFLHKALFLALDAEPTDAALKKPALYARMRVGNLFTMRWIWHGVVDYSSRKTVDINFLPPIGWHQYSLIQPQPL